jgi:mRNA-degrading endonuclease RelE of RelBE toxin-antitoxin system
MRQLRLDPEWAAAVISDLPPETRRRLKAALPILPKDPTGRTTGLDIKRLRLPGDPVYRLRIANWRAVFLTSSKSIDVMQVFHRDEGYAWLERRYPPTTDLDKPRSRRKK